MRIVINILSIGVILWILSWPQDPGPPESLRPFSYAMGAHRAAKTRVEVTGTHGVLMGEFLSINDAYVYDVWVHEHPRR